MFNVVNSKSFTPRKYRRRVFSQLWMLALQFVLGMVLNLLGSDTRGILHILYIIVLVIHILNAIGLVEGSIYIALKEKSKLSLYIILTLCATFLGGVLTLITKQDMWSFIMACGFIASSWLTVIQYIQADHRFYSSSISDDRN